MSRVAQLAHRAALLGCGVLTAILLLAPSPAAAESDQRRGAGPDATASIINGRNTSISEWPWQVALTVPREVAPKRSTAGRFFCGGSILAPRLVITAGHCVVDLKSSQIRKLEIISGRTSLNSNAGQVARVSGIRMPVDSAGKRKYRATFGTADWDVALLTLATPLSAQPIKLAGPDEAGTWSRGSIAWTTGWGITRAFSNRVPARLQLARQVLMGNGLCRRSDGVAFQPARMVCLGGANGNASSCNGDSGGPLVVNTSAGYRLVGLTSYGDGACRGVIPSVDTKVSGDPLRRWVSRTAMEITGVDVVGSGGTAGPHPDWCRIPSVFGLKPSQARQRLEAANCRLGQVRTDPWAMGRRGRIVGYNRLPGWLAPPGFRLKVWTAP